MKNSQDGRHTRSERSKKAIMDACEQLMKEGQLVPTAQMISDKADIQIRSFFRHFPDMASLFRALDVITQAKYKKILAQWLSEGTLEERIESTIKLRSYIYEDSIAITRSTKVQLWRHKILRDNYARTQRHWQKDLLKRIPEIKTLDKDTQAFIEGFISYEMWERLREHQKLSKARSANVMKQMLISTIKDNY